MTNKRNSQVSKINKLNKDSVNKSTHNLRDTLKHKVPEFVHQSDSEHDENDALRSLTSNDNVEVRKLIGYVDFL